MIQFSYTGAVNTEKIIKYLEEQKFKLVAI